LFVVVVTDHLSAFVKGRLEKFGRELLLAILADFKRHFTPHVSDQNDVLQALLSTEVTEYLEVSSCDTTEALV
jgi:hypothetical protein